MLDVAAKVIYSRSTGTLAGEWLFVEVRWESFVLEAIA